MQDDTKQHPIYKFMQMQKPIRKRVANTMRSSGVYRKWTSNNREN